MTTARARLAISKRLHERQFAIVLIREAQRQGRYVESDSAHLHFLFVGAASRVFLMPSEIERTMGCVPFEEAFIDQHITLCQSLFLRDAPADALLLGAS